MDMDQVNPPAIPGPEAAPAPHQPNDDAAGSILVEIESESEGDDDFSEARPTSEEDNVHSGEGARSSNANAATGLPNLVIGELQKIHPDNGRFNFNTKVFKRQKIETLQFDERGKTVFACVVRCANQ